MTDLIKCIISINKCIHTHTHIQYSIIPYITLTLCKIDIDVGCGVVLW